MKVHDHCETCHEALHHHRADDMPPYVTILIVGHIIVPLVLMAEQAWAPETWVHWLIWIPLTIVLSLLLLPRIKGGVVGLQGPTGCMASAARTTWRRSNRERPKIPDTHKPAVASIVGCAVFSLVEFDLPDPPQIWLVVFLDPSRPAPGAPWPNRALFRSEVAPPRFSACSRRFAGARRQLADL